MLFYKYLLNLAGHLTDNEVYHIQRARIRTIDLFFDNFVNIIKEIFYFSQIVSNQVVIDRFPVLMSVAILLIVFLDCFSHILFIIDNFIFKSMIKNPMMVWEELYKKRVSNWSVAEDVEGAGDYTMNNWSDNETKPTNVEQIGTILYTFSGIEFMLIGLSLLVGMIGAIILTLGQRRSIKRQDISAQVARDQEIELKDIKKNDEKF